MDRGLGGTQKWSERDGKGKHYWELSSSCPVCSQSLHGLSYPSTQCVICKFHVLKVHYLQCVTKPKNNFMSAELLVKMDSNY
jgi:hypothetical protein